MSEPLALVVLRRLRVQNANAVSGPLTWGFPPPSAFTGFTHALERRISDRRFPNRLQEGFGGIGIVCHRFVPQVTRTGYQNLAFNLTRNPVRKDGGAASFVEEGRAYMEVTLLITARGYMSQRTGEGFVREVMNEVESMRLAGGSILPTRRGARFQPEWIPLADDAESRSEQFRKLRRTLLPGFALVQREDILSAHMEELRQKSPQANALDALLDLSRLNVEHDVPNPEKPGETMWGIRTRPGWLVPLPIGYAALSLSCSDGRVVTRLPAGCAAFSPVYAPGQVQGSRDNSVPFRFVEALYSVGEWVSPHRLGGFEEMLWRHEADTEKGIYHCVNKYSQYHNTLAFEEA